MRTTSLSGLLALAFITTGCLDTATPSSPASTPAILSITTGGYPGVTSAQNISGTSIQVKWPAPSSPYTHVLLYGGPSGALSLLATLLPGQTTYIHSGLIPGNLYTYLVQASDNLGNSDGNQNVAYALTYSGINRPGGATSVTSSTAYINFPAPGVYSSGAHIYCSIRSGSPTLLATVTTPSLTTYKLTGLLSGTTYNCQVNAILASNGLDDANTQTFTFQTISQSSTAYQGVILVQAYGSAPNAPTSTTATNLNNALQSAGNAGFQSFQITASPIANTPTVPTVNLTWLNFNVTGASTATYRLTRVQQGGVIDMNNGTACTPTTTTSCQVCLNTAASAGTTSNSRTCTDTLVGPPPARYEYAVTLVVNSNFTPPMAEETPTSGDSAYRILVPIPPSNMVLVHRDSANYEMCSVMNKVSDPLNHQRCPYTGQGAVPLKSNLSNSPLNLPSGYYDFGYDLFVDRWQAGCNWTPSACSGSGSGTSGSDCFGNVDPTTFPLNGSGLSTVGSSGNIYFNASSAYCWVNVAGTWNRTGTYAPNGYSQLAYTNAPDTVHRKPMLYAGQIEAQSICQGAIDPNYGPKRLLRKREQIAASAFQWMPGEPGALTSTSIGILQNGTGYSTPQGYTMQGCATNYIGGLGGYPPNYPYFSPAFFNQAGNGMEFGTAIGSSTYSLTIGSDYSAACVSRFGIQDMVGNNLQFVSDEMACFDGNASYPVPQVSVANTCAGVVSTIDPGNTDLANFTWDGVMAPGGTGAGQVGPTYTTNWTISVPAFGANFFSAPLGIPLVSSDGGNALQIGTQITSSLLHTDWFDLLVNDTTTYSYEFNGIRPIAFGGNGTQGSSSPPRAGRFNFQLNTVSVNNTYGGVTVDAFHCALPAE